MNELQYLFRALGSVHNLLYISGWPDIIVAGQHRKLNVALPSINLHSPVPSMLYCSIHAQNNPVFVYLLTPWGKTIGPEVLYENIVHSSSGWPLISPIGILLPPIICHWGPHGGKFPHRLDIGAPIGAPMGPHGVPNGGQFPPWGPSFFRTPFLRVNSPPRKLSIFV